MGKMNKILCVVNSSQLETLRGLFRGEAGVEIIGAETGDQGLKVFAEDRDIRLVISDYQLPDMDGVECLSRVCEERSDTIRIIISEGIGSDSVRNAIDSGQITNFISGPLNDGGLIVTVSIALQNLELQRLNCQISKELQEKNLQLQKMNENLEQHVFKRTEVLEIRNRVLQIAQDVLDVLPVVVFGIDTEQLIVQCNDSARELFPSGFMGPLGNSRYEVFSSEINLLIDAIETERAPRAQVVIKGKDYRAEVRRLHETLSQGVVLTLIPE